MTEIISHQSMTSQVILFSFTLVLPLITKRRLYSLKISTFVVILLNGDTPNTSIWVHCPFKITPDQMKAKQIKK